jgi:hypothetical protein
MGTPKNNNHFSDCLSPIPVSIKSVYYHPSIEQRANVIKLMLPSAGFVLFQIVLEHTKHIPPSNLKFGF